MAAVHCSRMPLGLDMRVAKILLEREEVNPEKPDNRGRTPLFFAARYGYNRVVALLQPRKAFTPSTI